MQLEFHQLERRGERLRVDNPQRRRRLLASLADSGQQVPIDQRFQQAARFGSAQASFGTVAADMRTPWQVAVARNRTAGLAISSVRRLEGLVQ